MASASTPCKVFVLSNIHHTRFFIGVSRDLRRRFSAGSALVSGSALPGARLEKLVYMADFHYVHLARRHERELTGLSTSALKQTIRNSNPGWRNLVFELLVEQDL